jgi:hypothetical protein
MPRSRRFKTRLHHTTVTITEIAAANAITIIVPLKPSIKVVLLT